MNRCGTCGRAPGDLGGCVACTQARDDDGDGDAGEIACFQCGEVVGDDSESSAEIDRRHEYECLRGCVRCHQAPRARGCIGLCLDCFQIPF